MMKQACKFVYLAAAALAASEAAAAQCSGKTLRNNEAAARTVFEEVLGKGRIAENEHIYHKDFVAHGLTRDAGRDEDRAASAGWRTAFPDLKMSVLRAVVGCEMVAVHFEGAGTNTGEGNGLPATGKALKVQGMTFFRLIDGQISEEWTVFDRYTMLEQLGLLQ